VQVDQVDQGGTPFIVVTIQPGCRTPPTPLNFLPALGHPGQWPLSCFLKKAGQWCDLAAFMHQGETLLDRRTMDLILGLRRCASSLAAARVAV
jgi:hypothetical protein